MNMRYSSSRRSFNKILCAVLATAVTISLSAPPSSPAASRAPIFQLSDRTLQPIPRNSLEWTFTKYFGGRSITTMDYLNSLDTDKSLSYGSDPDGVTFARKADGTKARYVALSPDHVKIEISNQQELGKIELQRYSSERTLLRFHARGGGIFFVRTRPESDNNASKLRIEFQYGKEKAELRIDGRNSKTSLTSGDSHEITKTCEWSSPRSFS